jgi:hypothetical protein
LLTGIKDNSPAANAAKGTILATPALQTSLANSVAHLATALQLSHSTQDTRNILSAQTDKTTNGGRGGGKGGKGRGRGRGRGRGGRNIYLGSYHLDKWRKLSAKDRKRVIDGRATSAAAPNSQNKSQGSPGFGNQGRNASAVHSHEDYSEITDQVDQSILQGTLQGSAASGDKRQNLTSDAGSQMSRKRLASLKSSTRNNIRNISGVTYRQYDDLNETVSGFCELDSHADTIVAGANCVVLEECNQTVNVSAFSDAHKTINNVPIVTAATAFDDPKNGFTTILILGQAIYLGDRMGNTLLCPNQLRSNGLIVDECPKHLAPRDNPSTHSIFSPQDDFRIPLMLQGVTSSFPTRTPTKHEIETCQWVYLSNEYDWIHIHKSIRNKKWLMRTCVITGHL